MRFEELIRAFVAETGIDAEIPAGLDECCFTIDGMEVFLQQPEGTTSLITSAEVGEFPTEGREASYRLLLESMFKDERSGGAIFSLEPGTDRVWVHRRDSLSDLDQQGFREMLGRFVDGLEGWRRIAEGIGLIAPEQEKRASREAADGELVSLGANGFVRI